MSDLSRDSAPAASTPPSSRRPLRIWLILATVFYIPAVLLGIFAAMMSPMMFDAPGSTANTHAVVLFWSVLSFPFVCVAAVILGWIAFAKHHDRAALWLSLTPLIPIATGIFAATSA